MQRASKPQRPNTQSDIAAIASRAIAGAAVLLFAWSMAACQTIVPTATTTPADTPTIPAPEQIATATAEPTMPANSVFDIDKLLAGPRAYGADPFCLQLADTDDDGTLEWVGLREIYDADFVGGVSGFVLDGDDFYLLGMPTEEGAGGLIVGDQSLCDVQVDDLNGDGAIDVAIGGRSDADMHTLAIFSWSAEGDYRLLGSFGGTANVELNDENQDGVPDVIAQNCVAPGVALNEVSQWEGSAYVFVRSYYAVSSQCAGDLALNTPEQTLMAYYLTLDRRDLESAYRFLSGSAQERQPYKDYVLSVAAVRRFYLGVFDEVSVDGADVIVRGPLLTERVTNGDPATTRYAGEWRLRQVEDGWRIDQILLSAQ